MLLFKAYSRALRRSTRNQAKSAAHPITKRLRQLRGEMSQAAFGRKVGIAQTSICLYENGRIPHTTTLLEIARRCGVSMDWLIAENQEIK